jgi:hypothetical protein
MTTATPEARQATARRSFTLTATALAAIVAAPELIAPIVLAALTIGRVRDAVRATPGLAWILAAAVLWGLPFVLRLDIGRGAVATGEFAFVGLVLATFAAPPLARDPRAVATGVTIGLAVVAAIVLLQIGPSLRVPGQVGGVLPQLVPFGPDPLAFPGRASGWLDHPNIWGARVVVPGVFLALLAVPARVKVMGLAFALVTVLGSGSRGALVALAVGVLIVLLPRLRKGTLSRPIALAAVVFFAVAGLWAFTSPYGGRFDPGTVLAALLPRDGGSRVSAVNLFASSEDLGRDGVVWKRAGVQVAPAADAGTPAALHAAAWTITKHAPSAGARLQQSVTLEPDTVYTVAFDHLPGDAAVIPGLSGHGRVTASDPPSVANVRRRGGEWDATGSGTIALVGFAVTHVGDGWERVSLTFHHAGEQRLPWLVGPTPDQREGETGAAMVVRALQLERGAIATPYRATTMAGRIRAGSQAAIRARLDLYRTAWRGFLARPVAGAFAAPPSAEAPGAGPNEADRLPAGSHPHNLVLGVLYDRGLLGGAALAILLAGLARAGARVPLATAALLAAVLVANVADYVFWSAGIAYPVAAAIGWSAGSRVPPPGEAPATAPRTSGRG